MGQRPADVTAGLIGGPQHGAIMDFPDGTHVFRVAAPAALHGGGRLADYGTTVPDELIRTQIGVYERLDPSRVPSWLAVAPSVDIFVWKGWE